MSRQHSFDLAQFNSEPADLYLIIHATEILNISVRQEACQIARPIHAGTRIGVEGIRNKALGREVRATKVAARQAFPSEVQFTGNADWSWPRVCVQNVNLRVCQWTTDRDFACSRNQSVSRVSCILGWTVQVVKLSHPRAVIDLLCQASGKRFSCQIHYLHGCRDSLHPNQLRNSRRNSVNQRNLVRIGQLGQEQSVLGHDHLTAHAEWYEHFEHGEVEAYGSREQRASNLLGRENALRPLNEGRSAAVLESDSLRPASRSGSK